MDKVICDICGTTYPESAEQCPICGFARDMGAVPLADAPLEDMPVQVPQRQQVKGGRFSAANVRKRNNSTPRYQAHLVDDEDETNVPVAVPNAPKRPSASYAPKEKKPANARVPKEPADDSNKPLVIILIILIAAVLVVSAFLFTKYVMPGISGDDQETVEERDDDPAEDDSTEDPTIPCESLTLLDGTGKELTEEGQFWLLNVDVQPADTTDKLEFSSADEKIATVNEEGRIVAVAEGETVIIVSCGEKVVTFNVTCVFATEPTETQPTEPEPTEPPTTEPTEPPTTEPTEPEPVKMTVNVNKLSIRSGAGTNYDKVGSYKKGDEVTIHEQVTVKDEKWGRTDKGWICIDYCK